MKQTYPADDHNHSPEKGVYDPANPDSRMYLRMPNVHSQRRREALKTFIEEMQSTTDFIEGATVFGSTLHGKAHEGSDLDAYVFISPEKGDHFKDTDFEVAGNGIEFKLALRHELKDALRRDIMAGIDYDPAARNDIVVVPLNEDTIGIGVEIAIFDEIDYQEAYDDYLEIVDEQKQQGESSELQPPEPPLGLNRSMRGLFHPDVTGTLAPHRQCLIKELLLRGSFGEKLWQGIVAEVSMLEGDFRTLYKDFPQTLQEAATVFGVPDPRHQGEAG